ncbi:MAG: hypothetical protein F4Z01_06935 [Gammaproteobacteria bacterium]|nr:hypothetical protein [Gammaproteobacteria bacterium]
MAKQKFLVRRIGMTWQDKIIEAENAQQAKQLAECIDGDMSHYQSNFHEDQVEVEEADSDEELTEITADDQRWINRYHEYQREVARGGA